MSTPPVSSFLVPLPGHTTMHCLCIARSSRPSSTSTSVAHERCRPARAPPLFLPSTAQASVSKQLDCFLCNPVYSVDYMETRWPAEFQQKRTPLAISFSIPNIFPAIPSFACYPGLFPAVPSFACYPGLFSFSRDDRHAPVIRLEQAMHRGPPGGPEFESHKATCSDQRENQSTCVPINIFA